MLLALFAAVFVVSVHANGANMNYGCGWIPNVNLHEGTLPEERTAASAPLPVRFDRLAQWVGGGYPFPNADALPTLDQSETERCVVHAGGVDIYARLCEIGETSVLIDMHAAYVMSQRKGQERVGRRAPLADLGLVPFDFLDSCSEDGVIPCKGPTDPVLASERVNEDVWADEVRSAATHLVTGWRRIPDADDTVTAMKRALVAGFPGFDGMDLDAAFRDYSGGVYVRKLGAPSIGRHATAILGYDDTAACPDGSRGAFLKINSWDIGWGIRGWYWCAYSTFRDNRYVSDRTFLDAAPKGLR